MRIGERNISKKDKRKLGLVCFALGLLILTVLALDVVTKLIEVNPMCLEWFVRMLINLKQDI